MTIRLYTDAGVRRGLATWATVAVIPGREPIEASGVMREALKCSTTAEIRAIANALHKLAKDGAIKRGDVVEIFSDSESAVHRINGKVKGRTSKTPATSTATILKIAAENGITISARHIPGHKPATFSEHAPFNNRCDKLVRAARDAVEPPTKKRKAKPPRPAPAPAPPPRINRARVALDIARRLAGA